MHITFMSENICDMVISVLAFVFRTENTLGGESLTHKMSHAIDLVY